MYAFHLHGSADAPIALELVELPDDAATLAKASGLLDEHQSCHRIEVWDGDRPVAGRHRAAAVSRSG
jgi:hypothetical protein